VKVNSVILYEDCEVENWMTRYECCDFEFGDIPGVSVSREFSKIWRKKTNSTPENISQIVWFLLSTGNGCGHKNEIQMFWRMLLNN